MNFATILSFCIFHRVTEAWWDSGHALTMAVARQRLMNEDARDVIDLVTAFLNVSKSEYPLWSSFITSATYMDKIKTHTGLYNKMHYKDIPFASRDSELQLTGLTDAQVFDFLNNDSLVGAPMIIASAKKTLMSAKGVLADDYAPSLATDFALRAAVHVLGDIHQPLHSVGWFNDAFCDSKGNCDSDQGGNKVDVHQGSLSKPLSQTFQNLHALWDAMCGPYIKSVEEVDEAYFVAEALQLMKRYPADSLADDFDISTSDPFVIMLESYNMAMNQYRSGTFEDGTPQRVYAMTYMNFTEPKLPALELTDAYISWCEDACVQRVTLAGYRIASFLKDVAASTPRAAVDRAIRGGTQCASTSRILLKTASIITIIYQLTYHP